MNRLADLPNLNNFEFIGITHDDCEIKCRVLFDGKIFRAYKEDPFGPCLSMLKGWRYSDVP